METLTCATCSRPLERDPSSGRLRCVACSPSSGTEPETWDLAGGPSDAVAEALPSEVGPYEVLGELSRGGMGVIYRVRQRHLNRVVAMKVLIAGRDASADQIRRFLREARAAARLRHPHIVSIHDVGSSDGKVYFTMDLIEGESLHERLRRGRIPYREAVEILRQVADAVHYAHENGVIHRDIKPGNILIDASGRALLTDFGLARTLDSETLHTRSGTTMGTPHYMSPEQAQGENALVDARSDVYSLGAVFYEMLTGVPPFVSDREVDILLKVIHEEPVPPARRDPKIPRDLQTICLTCIEKSRDRRYPDARALVRDLEAFLQGEPIRARPAGLAYRLVKKIRKHRGIAAAALAGLTLSAGILAYKEWEGRAARQLDEERRRREEASRVAEAARERARREAVDRAEVALYAARHDEAIVLLEAFQRDYPDAPETPRVLLDLGVALMQKAHRKIEIDQDRDKEEMAALFARARDVFRELGERAPESPEAREAPVWIAKSHLWEMDFSAFDARLEALVAESGSTRLRVGVDLMHGAPKKVLQGLAHWIRTRQAEARERPPELKDVQDALLVGMPAAAAQKAMDLLADRLQTRRYEEALRLAEAFLAGEEYAPLRVERFFAMAVEIRRAAALLQLEREPAVVDVLTAWRQKYPVPEREFRERFPVDPRQTFEAQNPRPVPDGFPTTFLYQRQLRLWEMQRERFPAVREYDAALRELVFHKTLHLDAGAILNRALLNMQRYPEALALYEDLAARARDLDQYHRSRVDLLRGVAAVEGGDSEEARRLLDGIVRDLGPYLMGTGALDAARLLGEVMDELGNLGMLQSLEYYGQGLSEEAVRALRESERHFQQAADLAAQAGAPDLRAAVLLKKGLVQVQQPGAGPAAGIQTWRQVAAMRGDLSEPFHADVADLLLGLSPVDRFVESSRYLNDPLLRNDVLFWVGVRAVQDGKGEEAVRNWSECRGQSKGNEWPRRYVEQMFESGYVTRLAGEGGGRGR